MNCKKIKQQISNFICIFLNQLWNLKRGEPGSLNSVWLFNVRTWVKFILIGFNVVNHGIFNKTSQTEFQFDQFDVLTHVYSSDSSRITDLMLRKIAYRFVDSC